MSIVRLLRKLKNFVRQEEFGLRLQMFRFLIVVALKSLTRAEIVAFTKSLQELCRRKYEKKIDGDGDGEESRVEKIKSRMKETEY